LTEGSEIILDFRFLFAKNGWAVIKALRAPKARGGLLHEEDDMSLAENLLPEFDHEMENTRKTLERIPMDKPDWKPHEKSMPMGRLAVHVATLPGWAEFTINQNELDIAPVGGPPFEMPKAGSQKELLALFDESAAKARTAIAKAGDEHLMKPWSLLAGGKNIFTMPRVAVLRGMVMNHIIHHRAQLGVYLRLNDIPVPAIYGPSADEMGM
jgi:uncharacterized damage-inducible protein DinB